MKFSEEVAQKLRNPADFDLKTWGQIHDARNYLCSTIGFENQYFLTGSNAYGTPTPKSDIDIVLLLEEDLYNTLKKYADVTPEKNETDYDYEFPTLRFGKLNFICCSDIAAFMAWKEGTDELVSRKPVTREEAKQVLQAKRLHLQQCLKPAT